MGLIHRSTNWWRQNFWHRLLVSSLATTLISLTLLGWFSLKFSEAGIQREVLQGNRRIAVLVAKDINAEYEQIVNQVRLFRRQLESYHGELAIEGRAMLSLRQAAPLTFRALYLLDSDGQLLLYVDDPLDRLSTLDVATLMTRPAIPLPEAITGAYRMAQLTGLYRYPVHIVGADQVPVVYLGLPVAVEDGPGDQVIVAEVDLRQIWRRIDEVNLGQTGHAHVASQQGVIVAHPDRAYIGQPLTPALRPVLAGYEGQAEYTDPVTGKMMLAAYSPVGKQSGWGVVIEQEAADALAPVRALGMVTLGLVLAATAGAALITIFVARTIARPIQQLTIATEIIDRTGDLGQTVPAMGQDEIGQLASHFNRMVASLRLADQKLAEERNLLRTLIDNLPDYIYVKDLQSHIILGNEAVAQIMGASKKEDLIGRTDFDFFPRELAEKYYADEQEIIRSGQPVVGQEESIIDPAGQMGWISTTKVPIRNAQGEITGIVGLGRDITERRHMVEALQTHSEELEALVADRTRALRDAQDQMIRQEKLATLGQLAGGVAHELRNPLGAIKNAAYYLKLVVAAPAPEMIESLEIIDREIAVSEEIIRSLLAFAHLQSPVRLPVDVNKLMQIMIVRDGFQKSTGISLENQLDPNLPMILADETQLGLVFTHLFNNAIQAMSPPYVQEPGGRLSVSTSATVPPEHASHDLAEPDDSPEPDWISVSVSDTGVGIPPENMEHLFEPLFTTRAKGIGLGLAFVKTIVEGHGGRVEVGSKVGHGSKFTVMLPVARPEAATMSGLSG